MNKKEIQEIKKIFDPTDNIITRICGCYVNAEKEILVKFKEAFNSIPESDSYKYCDIFKQSLQGTIGKNLINMEFTLESEKEGGTQEFLYKLRESKLKDDDLLDEFFKRIIESYNYNENYYIILIHGTYDVPGKSTDGSVMFDASDNVYDYILCSICPVELSDAGLSYHMDEGIITDRVRDWIVGHPVKAFLFPAFNDRAADIHNILYYTKNSEEMQEDFIEQIIGAKDIPLSAKSQSEKFDTIVTKTLGDDLKLETLKNIQDSIATMTESSKETNEPVVLKKNNVKHLLEKCGASEDNLTNFDAEYDDVVGEKDTGILVSNINNFKKFSIKSPDIQISVKPDKSDLIETKIIDGKKYFLIPVSEDVTVNGINVTC